MIDSNAKLRSIQMPFCTTEAVVLTRVDDYPMQQLLRAVVDKHALLAHQQRVVSGEQEPSY